VRSTKVTGPPPTLFDSPRTAALVQILVDYRVSRDELHRASRTGDAVVASGRSGRPLRDAAVDVYTDMWLTFVRFLESNDVELHDVTRDHLRVYLSNRSREADQSRERQPPKAAKATKAKRGPGRPHVPATVSDRYAARLLRLIATLTAFHAKEHDLQQSSTAAAEMLKDEPYRSVHLRKNTPLPDPLSMTEEVNLLKLIMLPPTSLHPSAPRTLVEARDYCAVALQFGAGLTPHEVRSLKAESVLHDALTNRPIGLTVPRNGNTQARQTPLSDYARKALETWLDARREHRTMDSSAFLLPSTRGGQWPKNGLYEACEAVCARAGVQLRGGYRLRHTFILRQIRESRKPNSKLTTAIIGRWVGFKDPNESLAPYYKLLDHRDPPPT